MIQPTVLLVEDHPIEAKDLKICLENTGYRVVGTASTSKMAIALFEQKRPEIVILDIELGNEPLGGVEVAEYIKGKSSLPVLIYLTKHDDNRIINSANETLPSSFLVKPFTQKQVVASIKSGLKKISIWKNDSDSIIANSGKLLIPQQGGNKSHKAINLEDILFLKAAGAYCEIFLQSKTNPQNVSKNLRVVSEKLPPFLFQRIHRSYTINNQFVVGISRNPMKVILQGRIIELPVGRKYREKFIKWYRNSRV